MTLNMIHNVTPEPEKTLTIKQRQAALLLAEGATTVLAAEQIGVSRVTMERWKRQPLFQEEVRQAEDSIYDESLRMLKRNAKDAISCLIRNMNGKVSGYVQVQAAGKLLDLGLDVHKLAEVQADLTELRRMLNDAN